MRRFPPPSDAPWDCSLKDFPLTQVSALLSPAQHSYRMLVWMLMDGQSTLIIEDVQELVLPVFPALVTRPLLWTKLSDWLCSFYSNGAGSALFAISTFSFFLALENFICGDICCLLWFLLTDCETKTGFCKRLKVFFFQSSVYNLLMKNIKCFMDFQRDAWRLMITNEHLLPWWKHLFYKWCSIYGWCCSSQWVNLRLSS